MKIRTTVTIEVFEEGTIDPALRTAMTEVVTKDEGGNPRFIARTAHNSVMDAFDVIHDGLERRFGTAP